MKNYFKELLFLCFFYLSVLGCGAILAFQDTSKIEVYKSNQKVTRPYRVLGEVKTTQCDSMWERFTYDKGSYESERKAEDVLKQLAKANYDADAVINIYYHSYKEKKYAPCPHGGSGDCSLRRWCVKANGKAVAWLDKKQQQEEKKKYSYHYYDDNNKKQVIKCQDLSECLYLANYKFCDDKKLKEKIEIKEIDLDGSKITKEYEVYYDYEIVSSDGGPCFCGAKSCSCYVELIILRKDIFIQVSRLSDCYEILKTKTNGFYNIVDRSNLSYNEVSESYLVWDGKQNYKLKKTKIIKIKDEKKKKKKK